MTPFETLFCQSYLCNLHRRRVQEEESRFFDDLILRQTLVLNSLDHEFLRLHQLFYSVVERTIHQTHEMPFLIRKHKSLKELL